MGLFYRTVPVLLESLRFWISYCYWSLGKEPLFVPRSPRKSFPLYARDCSSQSSDLGSNLQSVSAPPSEQQKPLNKPRRGWYICCQNRRSNQNSEHVLETCVDADLSEPWESYCSFHTSGLYELVSRRVCIAEDTRAYFSGLRYRFMNLWS